MSRCFAHLSAWVGIGIALIKPEYTFKVVAFLGGSVSLCCFLRWWYVLGGGALLGWVGWLAEKDCAGMPYSAVIFGTALWGRVASFLGGALPVLVPWMSALIYSALLPSWPSDVLALRTLGVSLMFSLGVLGFFTYASALRTWLKQIFSGISAKDGLIWAIGSCFLVYCINNLDHGALCGVDRKHRVMCLTFILIPILAHLYRQKKFLWSGGLLFCLAALTLAFQCRLSFLGLGFALSAALCFLRWPRCTLWGLGTGWCSVNLMGIFGFWTLLRWPFLERLVGADSSFYERLVFWRHFGEVAEANFWEGLGLRAFFECMRRPVYYLWKGVGTTALASHAHCLWLDVRLAWGVWGVALSTYLGIYVLQRVWYDKNNFVAGVHLSLGCYAVSLYSSFFGIFQHTFVWVWLGAAWVLTEAFLDGEAQKGRTCDAASSLDVLRGTCC